MTAKIKICGITSFNDARLACGLGADMLGFNFYRASSRHIEPATAAAIIADMPKTCISVAVMVNPALDEIRRILDQCPVRMIQLHGDEPDDFCRQVAKLGPGVIKALRMRTADDLNLIADYHLDVFLLDAFHEKYYGGTGRKFDWDWIKPVVKNHKILLAGGVTPDNIEQALRVESWGVDVCSGVEARPGTKDAERMKLLFEKIAQFHDRP